MAEIDSVAVDAATGVRSLGEAVEQAAGVEPSRRIRVLVVDDHALMRRGVDAVLSAEPDIEVIGEAGDGKEALRVAPLLSPDIVLMDIAMPNMDGIEATAALKELLPSTRVVMLTRSDEESDLYDAIRAGASGYLLKDMAVEELPESIRAVHAGQSLISPPMASKLLTEFASMIKRSDRRQQLPAAHLTEREIEVLGLVARGMNNRDIARQLYISENTVKNHVRNILEKLQLHSRMEAVVYAVREKLLEIT